MVLSLSFSRAPELIDKLRSWLFTGKYQKHRGDNSQDLIMVTLLHEEAPKVVMVEKGSNMEVANGGTVSPPQDKGQLPWIVTPLLESKSLSRAAGWYVIYISISPHTHTLSLSWNAANSFLAKIAEFY